MHGLLNEKVVRLGGLCAGLSQKSANGAHVINAPLEPLLFFLATENSFNFIKGILGQIFCFIGSIT